MKNNKILIPVNSAKKKMIDSLKNYKNASEFIDFKDSENRVLANNIVSKNNIPEFDNSAVDGLVLILIQLKKEKKLSRQLENRDQENHLKIK